MIISQSELLVIKKLHILPNIVFDFIFDLVLMKKTSKIYWSKICNKLVLIFYWQIGLLRFAFFRVPFPRNPDPLNNSFPHIFEHSEVFRHNFLSFCGKSNWVPGNGNGNHEDSELSGTRNLCVFRVLKKPELLLVPGSQQSRILVSSGFLRTEPETDTPTGKSILGLSRLKQKLLKYFFLSKRLKLKAL